MVRSHWSVNVLAALALAGCGGSASNATAQKLCERYWTPGASSSGSFTRDKMNPAGKPDSVRLVKMKDIYGKPYYYRRIQWGKTAIMFNAENQASVAVCNLDDIP